MDINYVAAIVAALSSFLLGGLWYSPILFLKPWNRAMGRDENSSQGHPAKVFGLSFVFALAAALGFAHLLGPEPDMLIALHYGLIVGLLFVAASFGINYQFANRPLSALLIDGGYHTGQFVIYALILGAWH